MFFRKASLWGGPGADAPPVFQVDGVHYLHTRAGGLYWVATTRENVAPSLVLELLQRMYWIVRDYCGAVTEDSVRRNFLLVYELLDEVLDHGFPQNSSTERLKQFVATEPVVVRPRFGSAGGPGAAAAGPSEVVKSVLDTARTGAKEEIFVDVVEKLTAIFDAGGHLRTSAIVGAIRVKSYLTGDPPIRLGLPDNLVLGQRGAMGGGPSDYGGGGGGFGAGAAPVVLDSYSLHEAADATAFDRDRVLELVPPEGHFDLLTYRCSAPFRPPFRVYPLLEDDPVAVDKVTLYVRLRAEYNASKTATNVEVTVPLPASVQRVHCETDGDGGGGGGSDAAALLAALPVPGKASFGQSAEWNPRERRLVWTLRNVRGGRELLMRARLTLEPGSLDLARHEYGPIMLQFVLPGKPSASGMDVKYLRILKEERGYNPARWFRVVALANSYQARTG